MATIQVYRILVGARSAVLSILTDTPGSVSVHYKADSGSWEQMNCTEGENFFFRISAWEVDLNRCLQPETSYSLYVSAGQSNTQTYTFTTESVGDFGDYNSGYYKYDTSGHPEWTPTASQRESVEGENGTRTIFLRTLEDIGFQMSYFKAEHPNFTPSIYISNSFNGAAALTTKLAGQCWFLCSNNLYVYVHEYRHCFYFSKDNSSNDDLGDAREFNPSIFNKIGSTNWYKVFSMFSINGDKTEPQVFYGENSCDNLSYLYDFFILKLLALNPLTIIDG